MLQHVFHSFFFQSGKLTLSRLEGEHTHKRSGDELKAVERSSPVLVLFVRVHNWDAEEQQHLHRYLASGQHKCDTTYHCRISQTFWVSLHTHRDTPTFITLSALQLHGFLLHFLLSSGFRELSRM